MDTDPARPDTLIELATSAIEKFSAALQAGKWLVDVVPFCESTAILVLNRLSQFDASAALPRMAPGYGLQDHST